MDDVLVIAKTLQKEFGKILIEEFIVYYEVTNFIIGNGDNYPINVPVLEEFHGNLLHDKEVMAIHDKAYRTRTFHLCDQIFRTRNNRKNSIYIKTNKKNNLGVNDILRIDYRVTSEGTIYFLEANTVPRICSKNEAGFICKSQKQTIFLYNKLLVTNHITKM